MIAFQQGVRDDHYEKAKAAARKAMELDSTLPEAQIRAADIRFYDEWDWSQCDGMFRHAAEQAFGSSDVQFHYGICLEVLGRYEEALHYLEKARSIDPLSTLLNESVGRLMVRTGHTREAIEYLKKARDLDPTDPSVYATLEWLYRKDGRGTEAVDAYIAQQELRGASPEQISALTNAYRTGGMAAFEEQRRTFLRTRLKGLLHQSNQKGVSPLTIASLYASLGDFDQAFRWLDRAYNERIPPLVWLRSGIAWEPLHNDPRYQSLMKKMKMPD